MSQYMTWEQKFAAINAIAEASLKMRKPGDWYVSQNVEVKETRGSSVIVSRFGNGTTPEDAVEDHFNSLTAEQPLAYVRVTKFGVIRHVLWNGFMWVDDPESLSALGNVSRVSSVKEDSNG
jgi:hypothetical protein